MALTAAQLLDELMGRDRNLAPNEHREEKRWDDTDVCKYSLVEFCPHELFTNTRADLGTCYKVHDVEMSRELVHRAASTPILYITNDNILIYSF